MRDRALHLERGGSPLAAKPGAEADVHRPPAMLLHGEHAAVPPFAPRVAELHSAWAERRALKEMAASHDFDAQFRLLGTLYGWAEQSSAAICEVYHDRPTITLSPSSRALLGRSFEIAVDGTHTLTVSLVERLEAHRRHWRVVASFTSPLRRGLAPPQAVSRIPVWTRKAFEDLVLTVLDAYERDSAI